MTQRDGEGYRVIVVDDDKAMRESLTHLLSAAKWQVQALSRAEQVAPLIPAFQPDAILSDVRMPGMSGLELLKDLSTTHAPPVILISAHGDIPMAVSAMQDGAYSFLEKPFDPRRLLTALRHAAEQHRLTLDTQRLRAGLARLSGLDRVLLGNAPAIQNLRVDVLDLLGETGTGKELVARALHDLSTRSAGPFIPVNCAAIPDAFFETSMFGTTASAQADSVPGILDSADTGTLFLDEIGACPLPVQAKLLRILETREFTPLGSAVAKRADIRILSASNEKLDAAVAGGKFREDLLYRLNTVTLTLPPLRERRSDIPLLFSYFMEQYAALYEVAPPDLGTDDLAALLAHDWPGNVRELRHAAERRILAARRGRGSVVEAIRPDGDSAEVPDTLREAVAAFERQLIGQAIKTHKGRMDAVAEALGIGRRTLNEKIVKLGLKKDDLLT